MSWERLLPGLTKMLDMAGSDFSIRTYQGGEKDAFGIIRNKNYSPPISLRGLVVINPTPEMLSSVGIVNTTVELLAIVSAKTLKDAGLMDDQYGLVLTTDDLLAFGGHDYDIKEIQRRGIFDNIPLFVAIAGVKRGP